VLTVLSTSLKKAVEWGVIERMPCTVKLLKVPEGAIDFYDFAEFEAMVSAATRLSSQAALVVLLGGEAGLRGGEMRALEWSDVNFVKRQVTIERNDWKGQVTSTKGNRVRYVPMTARVYQVLQSHRHLKSDRVLCRADGSPMAEHHLVDLLASVARRASMRNNGPHILRHTFCSHLAMRGAPVRAVQELAGHKDLATTQRYMHLSPSAVDQAIRLLDQPIPLFAGGDIGETANSLARSG
jgi:integrase